MGYILPVNSYQSQQYANRLAVDPHFARVSRIHRVSSLASFQERFDKVISEEMRNRKNDQRKKQSHLANCPPHSEILSYINPNPANLSSSIAKVVGKGVAVNAYV